MSRESHCNCKYFKGRIALFQNRWGKIDISRCAVYSLFLMVNQFTSNHNYHLKAACKNSVVIRIVYFSRPMIFHFFWATKLEFVTSKELRNNYLLRWGWEMTESSQGVCSIFVCIAPYLLVILVLSNNRQYKMASSPRISLFQLCHLVKFQNNYVITSRCVIFKT